MSKVITNQGDIAFDMRRLPFSFFQSSWNNTMTLGEYIQAMDTCFLGVSVKNIHVNLVGFALDEFRGELEKITPLQIVNMMHKVEEFDGIQRSK